MVSDISSYHGANAVEGALQSKQTACLACFHQPVPVLSHLFLLRRDGFIGDVSLAFLFINLSVDEMAMPCVIVFL